MDTNDVVTFGSLGAVSAIIAAKWSAELGFRQVSQLLWAVFAFVLPPLALLALYVRWLYDAKAHGLPAGRWA